MPHSVPATADLLVVPTNTQSIAMPNGIIIHVFLERVTQPSRHGKLYTHAIYQNLSMKDTLTFKVSDVAEQQERLKVISVSVKDPKHIAQTFTLDDLIK